MKCEKDKVNTMENNTTYEQEIDLKDLLFAVLYKWRPILLIAILLGILLGGYKAVKELSQQNDQAFIKKSQMSYEQDLENYNTSKSNYERSIKNTQLSIDTQEKYLDNSILMKINPFKRGFASADIFVKIDDIPVSDELVFMPIDYGNSIVNAYTSYINSGIDLSKLSRKFNTEDIYIKELFSVTPDYDGKKLSINVSYKDEAGAKQILDMLLDGVNQKYLEFNDKFGTHNIYIMNETSGTVADTGLVDKQISETDKITSLQNSLKDNQTALTALKKPEAPSLSRMGIVKSGVKYAILGVILGAFIAIFCICVGFLMSDKISSAKEMKKRYGLRVLAEFPKQHKKRVFAGIDRWLEKIEGKKDNLSEDVRYDLMAANLSNYAGDIKKIMVIGTVHTDRLEEVSEKLGRLCSDRELAVGSDLNGSAYTVSKLPEFEAVLIVEQSGNSKYGEIEKEIETVYNVKREIVGVVII